MGTLEKCRRCGEDRSGVLHDGQGPRAHEFEPSYCEHCGQSIELRGEGVLPLWHHTLTGITVCSTEAVHLATPGHPWRCPSCRAALTFQGTFGEPPFGRWSCASDGCRDKGTSWPEDSLRRAAVCSGTAYPVNPDAPDEGADIHHAEPCAAHPDAAVEPAAHWRCPSCRTPLTFQGLFVEVDCAGLGLEWDGGVVVTLDEDGKPDDKCPMCSGEGWLRDPDGDGVIPSCPVCDGLGDMPEPVREAALALVHEFGSHPWRRPIHPSSAFSASAPAPRGTGAGNGGEGE